MRLHLITASLVMVFMMVTMASAGEFRPVTDIPMPGTGVSDPLVEKVEFVTTITPDDGEGPNVQLKDLVGILDDMFNGPYFRAYEMITSVIGWE